MSESLENTLREAEHCHAAGNISHAEKLYRAILSKHPHFAQTAFNLANLLKDRQDYLEAELFYRQALALEPELLAASLNLAFVLQEQGKFSEAVAVCSKLVKGHPDLCDASFNLACLQLLIGELPAGWAGYEMRFQTYTPVVMRHLNIPLWNGVVRSGIRLLVHTEQGFGDSIQMSRYLPVLAHAGIEIWLETTRDLAAILSRVPGIRGCILRGAPLPPVECQVPIMSLPWLVKTTCATIPPLPELPVDQILIQRMGDLLTASGKLQVGLCWTGRLDLTVNRKRSCPPEFFAALLEQPGISAVSLQMGHPENLSINDERLIDPTRYFTDFHQTAAMIANLDLVITIDSAVAHLAGTLGKPTWLLLPFVPDWRWLLDRNDSPWYPTMRIFRQPSAGDWQTVMDEVTKALAELLAESAASLSNRGASLDSQGCFQEALHCYQTAIARSGTSAIVHYNMGNTLKNLELSDQAKQAYQQALLLNPEIPEAYHNLAIILKEQGDFQEAYRQLQTALKLRPYFPEVLHTMGEIFLAEERFTDAISSLRTALADAPHESRIWNTLGIVYQCAERDLEAKECYQQALIHNPAHLHALNNMGAVCLSLGQPLEGIVYLRRLIALNPEYADGHWNLAGCLLAAGQYQEGWREYEWRWFKNNPIVARHQNIPLWDGRPLGGCRVLLWAEQGFGDTIQFIRYAAQVSALGGRVVLECQTDAIRQLCTSAEGVEQVVVRGEQLPQVDVQAPLLSLPGILGTSLADIPCTVPYLKIDPGRRQRWREWLAGDSGLRVGLVWGGRQTLRNRRRSCRLADFAPLAALDGVTFYSLQVGEQADEAAFPPAGMILRDPTHLINDFSDTAALIDCLDLVITIDTSVAHLAGSLGKPASVLLPTAADWRWLTERNDSPWYPTMTLFRQQQAGDWHDVMERLAGELAAILRGDTNAAAVNHMNNGDRFKDNEEWQAAFHCYLMALRHEPLHCHAHLRAGGTLMFLNRHEEALGYLQRAVALRPADPAPHITLALACLATGRYREGWREFEWRRHNISEPLPQIPELPPLKSGERLDGATILIHTEQGFGDQLQLVRYLPQLTALGAEVILSAPRELVRLFNCTYGHIRITTHGELLPAADYQTLLMSLPFLLADASTSVPAAVPYLAAPPQLLEIWSQRLAHLPGMKVGIAWQGRNMQKSGYGRALSLDRLAPLLAIPDVSFVTLQPCKLPAEALLSGTLHDMSPHITDFADTAALIANLDLVITVDTAVAHLAGALGHPCWVALLFSPDWRWFPLDQDTSSWYPSITLFRQGVPGDWSGVAKRLTDYLKEESLVRCGHGLGHQGLYPAAIDKFREAAALPSASCSTWLNLGIYLHAAGMTADGLAALKRATEIKLDYAEAWQNRGMLHQALGEMVEAYTCFRRALSIRPDYPAARWNLALLQLLLGDFDNGFRNFEQRFLKPGAPPQRHSDLPRWMGEDITGKTLLVHAEQGYGDTIQFLRYLPLLAGRGIKVVAELHDSALLALAKALPGVCSVFTRAEHRPPADVQIPIVSLPFACGTTLENIPAAPYYRPEEHKLERWWQLVGRPTGLKIGIVWSGSRVHKNNNFRSIPFTEFSRILNVSGVTFYSLQVGADALTHEDISVARIPLMDLTAHIHDFSDTAAFIANLDLVISVDTSTAHLAGAVGKPTWVLLPFAPDWRWVLGRDDTPWYRDMRLFRQPQPGDWGSVISEIVLRLDKMVSEIRPR